MICGVQGGIYAGTISSTWGSYGKISVPYNVDLTITSKFVANSAHATNLVMQTASGRSGGDAYMQLTSGSETISWFAVGH